MSNNVMGKIAKLSKESKLELKSEKVELGVADNLEAAVKNFNSTLDTADKVVNASIKANTAIKKVEQDVKYYNKYAKTTYQDISDNISYVQSLQKKAEAAAKDLGVNVEEIRGYKKASAFIIDAKSVANAMNSNPLSFDI